MSPLDVSDFLLTPEKAPAIIRSGGRGGTPTEWEKLIGPAISQVRGQDVLVQVFPKEGLPQNDEERNQAKRQAASRAASISNRYWHHVPTEHVETAVRLRPDGNYGVYATHHGPMTPEHREQLAKRRQPRPRSAATSPKPGLTAPTPRPAVSPTTESAQPTTAAERAKVAAARRK